MDYSFLNLSNAKITYNLTPDNKYISDMHSDELARLKEALDAVGVIMEISDNKLTIAIDDHKYCLKNQRFAGRKPNDCVFQSNKVDLKGHYVQYSDVVYMMQTMKDIDIQKELGMTHATYFRHKKRLLTSDFYRVLDKDKLDNLDYLKEVTIYRDVIDDFF